MDFPWLESSCCLCLQDIHFVALDCNDTRLAEVAKLKAESISSGDILTGKFCCSLSKCPPSSKHPPSLHRAATVCGHIDITVSHLLTLSRPPSLSDSLQSGIFVDGSLSTDLFPPRLLFQSEEVQSFDSVHDGYNPHLEQATAFHSSTGQAGYVTIWFDLCDV